MGNYIPLPRMEVYQLARELSDKSWEVFQKLDWHQQKIIGDQFIRAIDSVGANIAEGYGRYHAADRIKFYYNSRASLIEATEHWLELLLARGFIIGEAYRGIKECADKLSLKLNNFISITARLKKQ